jgi:hypothetical protein
MPEGYRKHRPYPGTAYTLADAAKDGLLLICRCTLCRGRVTRFLASDLVTLLDPRREADLPPFPCSRCGTAEYVRVKFHHPSAGDYGHLVVRRPAGIRRTQTWRSVKLGDEV